MAMRPSWVTLAIDNIHKTGTGPRSKHGSMDLLIEVREQSQSVPGCRIRSEADGETNTLRVYDDKGNLIFEKITEL